VPRKTSERDVVERVRRGCPFSDTISVQEIVYGVVSASRHHLGGGQCDDVVAIRPSELRSVLASQ
jgi:hypothetical protein